MTKEEATKKYYDLVEQCKIEDVDCVKYNYHHIEPLFELKEKMGVKTTKEIRGTKFDNGELLKCSVFHHIMLHYYLCFMFNRKSRLFYNAKHAFCITLGIENQDDICFTEDEVRKLAEMKESVAKTNINDEDKRLRKNRLCYDPRFEMEEIDYFVGRYISYGTLFCWIKWQKEQAHNPKYANITSCQFCNNYLILDEEGNTLQFDKSMNDEYREDYNKKLKERQKKNVRECTKRRRLNEDVKNRERENRNKLRHRVCKDPRFNKIERDSSHKPYEEYTTYYVLYDWAKRRLSSKNMTDCEKELLNSFNKAEDFAKFYLIKDENGNYIYKEPKGIVAWKENKKDNKHDYITYSKNARHKLCIDPRFGKEIKVTEYTNKIWDKEICSYNALGQWWDKNPNHEIVNGLSKKEFLRKYTLIDSEGNYIYDEETALKTIHNNVVFEI